MKYGNNFDEMKNYMRKMLKPAKRAKAIKIEVKRIVDEHPDLSFLNANPEFHYGIDGAKWADVPEDDIQETISKFGSIWNACADMARRDEERLDAYNRGIWEMIGIKAVATIHIPIDDDDLKIQTIESGGLWGIESDVDKSYTDAIGKEEIDIIKRCLRILCVKNVDNCEIVTE